MERYPEAVRQRDLRPVVTLIGSPKITEEFILTLCSFSSAKQMDFEQFTFAQEFECKRETKVVDRLKISGILPKHWPTKRRKFLPAVLVLLFDWTGRDILDPPLDGPEWRHKEAVILRELRRYRDQMRGRYTKLCIFVFSGTQALDSTPEERTSQLRKLCELESKAVYIKLGGPSALSTDLAKIQKFLYDSAIGHYKDETERIKKAKNRTISVELQIRYNFKLGYLMELREDKEGGLRYYQIAYNDLQSISPISANHYREIKGVSDWILLRICLLLTSHSLAAAKVKEAIDMFKSHWLKYRVIRHNEVNFEIWAWQVQQFAMFAQLLEGVNANFYEKKNKLTLPGFYYETAGIYSLKRFDSTKKSESFMAKAINWNDIMEQNNLRFKDSFYVGQLSSLASHPLQDTLNSFTQTEQDSMSLTVNELKCDPLTEALNYFNKARKFYSDLGAKRSMASVCNRIADLNRDRGDLEGADIVLKKVHSDYKEENWPLIQKVISRKLLESSVALGRNSDMLKCLLETMSLDPAYAQEAFAIFQSSMMNDMINLEIEGEDRYMGTKSQFTPKHISHYDSSELEVTIVSRLPASIENVAIELRFLENQFNQFIATNIKLDPGVAQTFTTQLLVKLTSIRTIELKSIIVHYSVTELSTLALVFPAKKTKLTLNTSSSKLSVDFKQSTPALIAEDYIVKMTLTPELPIPHCSINIFDDSDTANRKLSVDSSPVSRKSSLEYFNTRDFSVSLDGIDFPASGLDLTEINSVTTLPIKFIFTDEGSKALKVRLRYVVKKTEAGEELEYMKEETHPLDIRIEHPFSFSHKWNSDTDFLPVGEVATLVTSISPKSFIATKVNVYRIELALDTPTLEPVLVEDLGVDQLQGVALSNGEIFGSLFQVNVLRQAEGVTVGNVVVEWSRPEGPICVCRYPIHRCSFQKPPLEVTLDFPSKASLNSIFNVNLSIKNCADKNLKLNIKLSTLESSFLYGGYDNLVTSVDQFKTAEFNYVFIPSKLGPQPLPTFEVTTEGSTRTVKRSVLVLP
mmetsp:Transcript_9489/g.18316  ORF Transcript_9489/g.18316 Transcript_9489/m.18316 type:complete len:1030 (-) Transcript_9489:384-3473(-)